MANHAQPRANTQESQESQESQGYNSKQSAATTPAPDLLALVAWSGTDVARFTQRRDRLTRWGWPATAAEAMARQLTLRDLAGEDRHACFECSHHQPGRCGNHRAAGLQSPEVGRDLAALLQRCPGFKP